jgi:hypothetical protein
VRFTHAFAAVAMLVGLSACDPDPVGSGAPTADAAAPLPSASATTLPATSAAALGAAYTDDQLPVPSDFEEKAAKTITDANYKKQLAELDSAVNGAASATASASSSVPGAAPAPAPAPAPPAPPAPTP